MKTHIIKSILLILVLIITASVSVANAQFTEDGTKMPIQLVSTPNQPKPGQTAIFKVVSYGDDLDTATYTWYVNGTKVVSGTGIKSYTVTIAKSGSTNIAVDVLTTNGDFVTKSYNVGSLIVKIHWQAESYTPPFYKGRSLLSRGNSVILTASIEKDGIVNFSPKNYIYTWKKDGTLVNNASGFGKNVLTISGNTLLKNTPIEVTVKSPEGNIIGSDKIQLVINQPKLIGYKYSPTLGIDYSLALPDVFSSSEKEVSLALVPYFFKTNYGGISSVAYYLSVNDNTPTMMVNNILTFRNTTNATGTSKIFIEAKPIKNSTLQNDTVTYMISY